MYVILILNNFKLELKKYPVIWKYIYNYILKISMNYIVYCLLTQYMH